MKIFIASPVYGAVDPAYHASMLKLLSSGADVHIHSLTHDSLITRARDRYASWFLRTKADVCLWIDSDIGFEPRDAVKISQLALQHDFVCGAYPLKGFDPAKFQKSGVDWEQYLSYCVNLETPARQLSNGLISVRHAGTGFMAWSRPVAETLMWVARREPYRCSHSDQDFFYPIFKTPVRDGLHLSEDWYVCDTWKDFGGTVWLDPSIKLSHSGRYTFQGDFGKAIRCEKC